MSVYFISPKPLGVWEGSHHRWYVVETNSLFITTQYFNWQITSGDETIADVVLITNWEQSRQEEQHMPLYPVVVYF